MSIHAILDKESRTGLFAYLDLGTQLLTLFIQLALSGIILRRLGVSFALTLLPLVYLVGFTALAFHPSLSTLMVTMVLSRGVGYGITVPSREVLFTVVSREDKYKSKNFIDTVVLRGGDTAAGQIVGSLRGLGVPLFQLNVWASRSSRSGPRCLGRSGACSDDWPFESYRCRSMDKARGMTRMRARGITKAVVARHQGSVTKR